MKRMLLGFMIICSSLPLWSMSADQIVQRIDQNQGYKTAVIEARIVTKDRLGSSVQDFISYANADGDTLVAITSGVDKGQKVLRKGSSIYLYYPDAEEVVRLQGSALKDSFMGSDFSYEDLTGDDSIHANYKATLLGTVQVDDHECYHMEFLAKNKKQTYQKQEAFIDAQLFSSRRTILYSASGRALREIVSNEFKEVGGYVFATSSVMKDLMKKNSSTTMTINSIEIDTDIPASYFTKEGLLW